MKGGMSDPSPVRPDHAPALGGARARRIRVETLAGDGLAGFADGPGRQARFHTPWGVVADPAGNVYVADSGNHRIRRIAPDGTVTTVAGCGEPGLVDGAADEAMFRWPRALARDAAGILYIADTTNHCIRKITRDGQVTTFSGAGVAGFLDGPRADARFNLPNGVAVAPDGALYVADAVNVRVRRVSPGGTVTTYAGEGVLGYADGCSQDARFTSPRAIAIDTAGILYVSDVGNSRVRKVNKAGTVFLLAGNGRGRCIDGPGPHASFREPCGLAVDADGNVYVADTDNHCLRLIGDDAMVDTLTGDGHALPDLVDGPGPAARFNTPTGLCLGPAGELYVADAKNHCIRRVVLG